MSVYKEGYFMLSKIQQYSQQLFSDACDFGALTKKGDPLWNMVKDIVDRFGVKSTRQEDRYSTGESVHQIIELMDEWNTGNIERFRISYTSIRGSVKGYPQLKKYDGYLMVDKIE